MTVNTPVLKTNLCAHHQVNRSAHSTPLSWPLPWMFLEALAAQPSRTCVTQSCGSSEISPSLRVTVPEELVLLWPCTTMRWPLRSGSLMPWRNGLCCNTSRVCRHCRQERTASWRTPWALLPRTPLRECAVVSLWGRWPSSLLVEQLVRPRH